MTKTYIALNPNSKRFTMLQFISQFKDMRLKLKCVIIYELFLMEQGIAFQSFGLATEKDPPSSDLR